MTATEIRRDVEGYSDMTEDAFARRFYADRAELESLGINLSRGQAGRRLLRAGELLPRRARPSTSRRSRSPTRSSRRLQTALSLLDGEFAYAEPLRLALQQITWGRPSPLDLPAQRTVGLGITAAAGGHDISQRIAKIDTAIYRRKRVEFEYHTMATDETGTAPRRPVPPALRGRAVLPDRPLARARARCACSGWTASRARSPTRPRPSTTSSAPRTSIRAGYANHVPWQLGAPVGTAEVWFSERIAWMVERHFAGYGDARARRGRRRRLPLGLRASAPAGRVGVRLRRARPDPRPARARRGRPRAAGPHRRGPPRRAARHRRRPRTSERAARRAPRPPRTRRSPAAAPARDRDPPGALRAPRHARVRPHPRRPRGRQAAGRRGPARRCRCPSRSSARTSTSSTSSTSAAAPTCSTPRSSPRRDRGRHRAVLGHVRPPRPPAADRGQGARRRHRPDRRPPARRRAGLRARQDRRRARRGPGPRGPAGHDAPAGTTRASRASSPAPSRTGAMLDLEYYAPAEDRFSTARSSPTR